MTTAHSLAVLVLFLNFEINLAEYNHTVYHPDNPEPKQSEYRHKLDEQNTIGQGHINFVISPNRIKEIGNSKMNPDRQQRSQKYNAERKKKNRENDRRLPEVEGSEARPQLVKVQGHSSGTTGNRDIEDTSKRLNGEEDENKIQVNPERSEDKRAGHHHECQHLMTSPSRSDARISCIFEQLQKLFPPSTDAHVNMPIFDLVCVVLARWSFERRVNDIPGCQHHPKEELYNMALDNIVSRFNPAKTILNESDFARLSVRLLEFILDMDNRMRCVCNPAPPCAFNPHDQRPSRETHSERDVKNRFFQQADSHYIHNAVPAMVPVPIEFQMTAHANRLLCVNDISLKSRSSGRHYRDTPGFFALHQTMISYILLGYQIINRHENCPVQYLHSLIHDYGNTSSNTFDEQGLSSLMQDLRTNYHFSSQHNPVSKRCSSERRPNNQHDPSAANKPPRLPLGTDHIGPQNGHQDHQSHTACVSSAEPAPIHGVRHIESFLNVDSQWDNNWHLKPGCYSAKHLMETLFGRNRRLITAEEFQDFCPALVRQLVSGTTNHAVSSTQPTAHADSTEETVNRTGNVSQHEHNGHVGLERWKCYLYGSLSVFVISLSSLLGGVFINVSSPTVRLYVMPGLLALAVGCLVADAALHLLPEVLSQKVPEQAGSEEGNPNLPNTLYQMCAFLGSIYAFFLLELSMTRLGGGHSHDGETHSSNGRMQIRVNQEQSPTDIPLNNIQDVSKKINVDTPPTDAGTSDQGISLQRVNNFNVLNKKNSNSSRISSSSHKGVKNLALMVMIGDGIHNVADGLAIGAAFSLSFKTGLSTALAVLCHEIPHELGDFAVLLSTGISIKKAMLFNFLCSLTSFVGLYAGISVGNQENADRWIFSVGAGMFFYVSLTNLIPECKEIYKRTPSLAMFVTLNIGLLLGYAAMLLMAIFEDELALS